MLDRADAILKLALAVAVLVTGCSVGYYYAIFLPAQAKTELARTTVAAEAKAVKASAAKKTYLQCVSDVRSRSKDRWEKSCKRLHAIDAKRFPAKDCSLPPSVADSYGKDSEEDKRFCLDELKAGT